MAEGNVAADQLRLFIERIERLEEEKKGIADDVRDVYSEAKSNGYDTKTMRKIVASPSRKPRPPGSRRPPRHLSQRAWSGLTKHTRPGVEQRHGNRVENDMLGNVGPHAVFHADVPKHHPAGDLGDDHEQHRWPQGIFIIEDVH